MNTPNTDKALLKVDTRPDGSIELQYANSSVPIAVMCWNGSGTAALGKLLADSVNEHAALCAVAEAARQLQHSDNQELASILSDSHELDKALAHLAQIRKG